MTAPESVSAIRTSLDRPALSEALQPAPEVATVPQSFASQGFSHRPPYALEFAERVPLLQVFTLAIQNYRQWRAGRGQSWGARLRQRMHPGHTAFRGVECGVFTGSSLLACASLARDAAIPFRLTGLDTFEGLPPLSETDLSLARPKARYLRQTMFTETSAAQVRQRIRDLGFEREVAVRQGLFSDILPTLAEQKYHFVNIDCDLYEPHIECLEYFYPRMLPGAVVFFDDYHSVDYPMAGRAIDDFMQGRPERLMHLRFGQDAPNRTKTFFIKY